LKISYQDIIAVLRFLTQAIIGTTAESLNDDDDINISIALKKYFSAFCR
jgi:hypothetical protein